MAALRAALLGLALLALVGPLPRAVHGKAAGYIPMPESYFAPDGPAMVAAKKVAMAQSLADYEAAKARPPEPERTPEEVEADLKRILDPMGIKLPVAKQPATPATSPAAPAAATPAAPASAPADANAVNVASTPAAVTASAVSALDAAQSAEQDPEARLRSMGVELPEPRLRDVMVVGNGRSMLGKGMGKVIDSFREVVRFNIFKTKGYEADVGSKTTAWILSTIRNPDDIDEHEMYSLKKVYIPMSLISLKPARVAGAKERLKSCKVVNRFKAKVWVGAWRPELHELTEKYKLQEKHVSSGLQALMFFGKRNRHTFFVGFDFEEASHQHYWENKIKNATCHNMQGEAEVLRAMEADGVVKRLLPSATKAPAFGRYSPNCQILCNTAGVCQKLLDGVAVDEHGSPIPAASSSGDWVKGVGSRTG